MLAALQAPLPKAIGQRSLALGPWGVRGRDRVHWTHCPHLLGSVLSQNLRSADCSSEVPEVGVEGLAVLLRTAHLWDLTCPQGHKVKTWSLQSLSWSIWILFHRAQTGPRLSYKALKPLLKCINSSWFQLLFSVQLTEILREYLLIILQFSVLSDACCISTSLYTLA